MLNLPLFIALTYTIISIVWFTVEGGYEPLIVLLSGFISIIYTGKEFLKIREEKKSYFPKDIIEELNTNNYSIVNASEEDILWITQKTKELHGSHAVAFETKLSWYKKNKTGFFIVKDGNGKNIGSIDLFPVKLSVINDIASGKIHESEKKQEDIISNNMQEEITCLYLENMMALKEGNKPNIFAFKAILKKLPYILKKVCKTCHNVKLYTMSAKEFNTIDGVIKSNTNDMLDKFGFTKLSDNTIQNLPLYYSDTKEIISKIKKMFV